MRFGIKITLFLQDREGSEDESGRGHDLHRQDDDQQEKDSHRVTFGSNSVVCNRVLVRNKALPHWMQNRVLTHR